MSRTQVINNFLLISIGLLIVVLPQINITDYVQSTITSKFIVFAYCCLFLFGGLIIKFTVSKPKTLNIKKLDIILLFLFIYLTINRYFIQSDFSFSIRYLELFGLVVLYFVLRTFNSTSFLWLLLAVIISGIFQSIHGNLQLLGYSLSNHSGFKMTGSFFNPGPYAGFLTAVWPIALGMYLFKENIIAQIQTTFRSTSKILRGAINYIFEYIPLLGLISIAIVIPATRSRGAWLAVLISSLVLLELKYHFIKNIFKKITGSIRVVLISILIIVFGSVFFGIYNFKKGSADGRLFIWKVSSKIVKDYPISGVGFDRFKAHYMNYQANYFKEHGETKEALVADNIYYTFNEWLQFTVENGLIGLLLLLLLMYSIFKLRKPKKQKHMFIIVCNAFLAIGLFALVSYPLQILPIKIILIMLLAIIGSLDRQVFNLFKFKKKYQKYTKWIFRTAIFMLGTIGIYKGVVYIKTLDENFKQWQMASTIYQYGDYKGSVEKFENTYPILKKDGDFLMNYGKALSMSNNSEKAMQILEEAKLHLNTTIIETALGDAYKNVKKYNNAETAYQHAANMIPVRFYPLYLQAKLYDESGDKKKAIAIANKILNKDVKIPSTAIKEIKSEMKSMIKNPLDN